MKWQALYLRPLVCAGFCLSQALLSNPAHAQVQQGLENTTDLAANLKDISDSIENVEKLEASKRLREFKRITGAIGDLAPYLGLISIIGSFATLAEESDLTILLKKFDETNRKIDNLSVQLQESVKQINVGGDVNNQKETVRSQYDLLSSAKSDLKDFIADPTNGARAQRILDRNSVFFSDIAETAKNRCTGDFMEQTAIFYEGNIEKISEVGYYLLRNIQTARDLDSQFSIAKTKLQSKAPWSPSEVSDGSRKIIAAYESKSEPCTQAMTNILAKYNAPLQRMNSAQTFLEKSLNSQGSAGSIVATLKAQYPYLNWVAVKYDGVAGSDNHYGVAAASLRMILRKEPARPWNLVIGNYEKKAWFDNARYGTGACGSAFAGLAAGIPSSGPNGTTYLSPWGSEDVSGGALWFNAQCGRPPLAGFWIARTGINADFAASDPATVSQDPAQRGVNLERAGAFYFDGTKRAYLVMPEPAGIAESRPGDNQASSGGGGQSSAAANSQAQTALQAALKLVEDTNRKILAQRANLPSFGYNVNYRVEIDFCHSDLKDTETTDNITVEFLVGSVAVAVSTIKGSDSDCGTFSKGILTATAETDLKVDSIRISTDGSNGMFIDQVHAYRDNASFIWDGRNNGGGWCLSTDPNDFRGGWESVSGGCEKSYTFNNPG